MRFAFSVFFPLLFVSMLFPPGPAVAQQDAPWWPHPLWGAEDQAGGSNWVTPAKVLEAISLVETGDIYELGHVYEREMPLIGSRTFAMFIPARPTGGSIGDNLVSNDEVLIAEIGQVGTQFDGPGHVGKRMTREDGTSTDVFYNGVEWNEMASPYGLRKLGVENVGPYITRGILIDIAGFKNVETLPQEYVVTMEDVDGALRAQGLSSEAIRPGDAVFFNFGWWRLWPDPAIGRDWPGIGRDVVDWIVERDVAMVGSDAATDETGEWAVHEELVLKNGIFNLEFMTFASLLEDAVYEFMFVFTPLRLKGATGSPGRPLAIR